MKDLTSLFNGIIIDGMKLNIAYFIYPVLILWVFTGLLIAQPDEGFEKGKIIEKVVCRHNPAESYALYLPTAYTGAGKWPVLFAFDPGGRTTVPLALFKPAAEKYNYIAACPTNAKNGPRKPVVDAMGAVWQDVCARFPVDKQRIYVTGFSGGSRVATFFKYAVANPVRGIIACGAALSPDIKAEQIKPASYFGIVGFADFNYREMAELDQVFDRSGVTHRFIYFDGKHRWPPEAILTRAVAWLELRAIKEGAAPPNRAFSDALFENELNAAKDLEGSGSIYFAVPAYESAARDFKGTVPDTEIEKILQTIARLEAGGEFEKFQKEEQQRLQKERNYIVTFGRVFGSIKQSPPGGVQLQKILAEAGIKHLEKELKKGKNIYDTGLAERLLYNLGNQALQEGDGYFNDGDHQRAAFFLEIAAASGKGTYFYPYALYRLAAVYAVRDKKKKALKFLEEAIENGYTDIQAINADKNLDALRGSPRFDKMIRQLTEREKE